MTETLLLRGGLLYDGTGAPPRAADLLVQDGRVARIQPELPPMPEAREIDARGCWVTPGFIDIHTHYDAEVALSPGLKESVRHGVTSVVLGSCSISFVASEAEDCADMFTRVEALPRERVLPVLRQIKTWNDPAGWRAWLERQPLGPNVAAFLGHSDLRCRAMGLLRSVDRRLRPNEDELGLMKRLLGEALDIGMLGMSSMTNPWDRLDGDRAWSAPLPSVFARGAERRALEALLRERGAVNQSAPNLVTRVNVLGMVLASAALGRRPLKTTLITMMDLKADPYVHALTRTLAWLANRVLGGDFRWQALPVPFELFYDGMDSVLFEEFPAGQAIRDLARDPAGRTLALRDPAWRARFRNDMNRRLSPRVWHRDLADTLILDCPDPSTVHKSFAQVAADRGADVVDTFVDLLAEHDRALRWTTTLANHRPERLLQIMAEPDVLIGFADSGAHLRNMAFYNFPLRMLKRVHEAGSNSPLTVEAAIHRLSAEPARWFNLDAGTLHEGARADLVVIDPSRLDDSIEQAVLAPFPELGEGFDRLVNRGSATRSVLVAGQEVVVDGQPLPTLGSRRTGSFLEARVG